VAQDVTFLGATGADAGGQGASVSGDGSSKPKPSKKQDDVVIEDIGDEPINLDDIPF
jgi:hypothetical protein